MADDWLTGSNELDDSLLMPDTGETEDRRNGDTWERHAGGTSSRDDGETVRREGGMSSRHHTGGTAQQHDGSPVTRGHRKPASRRDVSTAERDTGITVKRPADAPAQHDAVPPEQRDAVSSERRDTVEPAERHAGYTADSGHDATSDAGRGEYPEIDLDDPWGDLDEPEARHDAPDAATSNGVQAERANVEPLGRDHGIAAEKGTGIPARQDDGEMASRDDGMTAREPSYRNQSPDSRDDMWGDWDDPIAPPAEPQNPTRNHDAGLSGTRQNGMTAQRHDVTTQERGDVAPSGGSDGATYEPREAAQPDGDLPAGTSAHDDPDPDDMWDVWEGADEDQNPQSGDGGGTSERRGGSLTQRENGVTARWRDGETAYRDDGMQSDGFDGGQAGQVAVDPMRYQNGLPAQKDNGKTARQKDGATSTWLNGTTARRQNVMTAEQPQEGAQDDGFWRDWDDDGTGMPEQRDGMPAYKQNVTPGEQYGGMPADRQNVPLAYRPDVGTAPRDATKKGKGMAVLIAIIATALTVVLACGGYAIYLTVQGKQEEARQQEITQQAKNELTQLQGRWERMQGESSALITQIEDMGLNDDPPVKKLMENLQTVTKQRPMTSTALRKALREADTAYKNLNDEYGTLMDKKAEETGKTLQSLIQQGEGLKDAPDSTGKQDMEKLMGEWKGVQVTKDNLKDAGDAGEQLRQLVAKVAKEKADKRAKDDAEKKAKEQAEAQKKAQQQQQQRSQSSNGSGYSYTPRRQYTTPKTTPTPTPKRQTTTPAPTPTPTPTPPPGNSGTNL